jgi:small subunit ribosomal protein S1
MTTKTTTRHPFEQYMEEHPENFRVYQAGEIVAGIVTAMTKNRIWVDVDDGRFVGIISNRELAEEGISAPDYKVGDSVTASVLIPENEDGFIILSLRDALENQGWTALSDRMNKDEVFEARVVEANRGGLIVEADGLRGFLPVSQLAPEHYPRVGNDKDEILSRLAQFEGTTMKVKVLDLDKNTNKLIFSEKVARRDEFEALVSGIAVGDVLEGTVSGVVDFGIFVTLGRIEGLVHISEISWGKVEHPSQFAKVGDKIKVQVIGIEDDKISLSMKRLESDPWLDVISKFAVGQEIEVKVTQIMPFGVFVSASDGVDGLIHISELSHDHITDPSTVVAAGDKLKVKVIDLGADSHRLGLSLKALTKPTVETDVSTEVKSEKLKVESGGSSEESSEPNGLQALGLTPGVIVKLNEAGIASVADLASKTVEDLEALPGIGAASAKKIFAAMNK